MLQNNFSSTAAVDKNSCHRIQESRQKRPLAEKKGSKPLVEICPEAEIALLSCRMLQEHSHYREELQRWKETGRQWQWKDLTIKTHKQLTL